MRLAECETVEDVERYLDAYAFAREDRRRARRHHAATTPKDHAA